MPDQQQFLLVRTTTEEYEYDPDKLREMFREEFEEYKLDTAKMRERYRHAPMGEREMWESFLIELFERHDGSQYGDTLFSSTASDDYGITLGQRSYDE